MAKWTPFADVFGGQPDVTPNPEGSVDTPAADGEEGGWFQDVQDAMGYTDAKDALQRETDETQERLEDIADAARLLAAGLVVSSVIVGAALWYKSLR